MVVVHPAFDTVLAEARAHPEPDPWTVTIAERRQAFVKEARRLRGEMAPMSSVEEFELALEGRSLGARLYVPEGDQGRAIVLYVHGGCFVVGDLETHAWLCRRLAYETKARLLAIDYRLAPEHPFPAGLEDVEDAIRFLSAHREMFGASDSHVILMGDSAGANLVTVAARELRDEPLDLAAQVLIYPTLGPELLTDSAHRYAKGFLLDVDHLRYDYRLYLDGFGDHTDPRVAPLFYGDLAGVAPAVVIVAQCDPLRDEGVAYAGLLEHCGVPVQLLEAEGMVHGFLEYGGVVPEALAIVDDLAEHLHALVNGDWT